MAKIKVENRHRDAFCLFPKAAADYLTEAGADELRTLIFLLSKEGDVLRDDIEEIGMTMERFVNCVSFWGKRGILEGIRISLDETDNAMPVSSVSQVAQHLDRSQQLRSFIEMAELLLGKTLSTVEITTLYDICDSLKMTPEVVIMLIEHCSSQGKTSIRYIEKTAMAWAKEGILTHDRATAHLEAFTEQKSYEGKLRRLFKIRDRNFSPTEMRYINKWRKQEFPQELLLLAYDKTLTNTGKVAFAYMDKILQNWQEQGVTAPEEVAQIKGSTQKLALASFGALSGRFDYDEFEKRSLELMKNQSKKGK
jgi:DnaD/phage-associated family protein